jgi:hypothetical protein
LKKRSIKIAGDARPGTVADMFEAYVQSLKNAVKPSWSDVEYQLNKIAGTLGRSRLARDITPDDVLGVLRLIYGRDKLSMADHTRSIIGRRIRGPSNPSTITAAPRLAGSNSITTPRQAFRPSRRSPARGGLTNRNSSGCTVGSNTQTRLCIRRTRAQFAF